jgi:uncharacterized lipoprotein YajG
MRFVFLVVTVVALLLTACNGPQETPSDTGPENILVQTPEYTGVIVSENGVSEFCYWQIDYVVPKDECIHFSVHGES